MELKTIHRQMIDYVEQSGTIIEVNTSLPTVSFKVPHSDIDQFLEGHQAEEFIAQAWALYNAEDSDLTMDDAYALVVYERIS